MKRESAVALAIATAAFTLLIAQFASAQAAPSKDTSSAEMQQAMQMVPAQASLAQTIDASKVQQGDQIKATLSEKVQLKNGPELPSGTELIGQVTEAGVVDVIANQTTEVRHRGPDDVHVEPAVEKIRDGAATRARKRHLHPHRRCRAADHGHADRAHRSASPRVQGPGGRAATPHGR